MKKLPSFQKPQLEILYLVSMPIGNWGDISERGKEVLQAVATVIVEEYRTGKKNLDRLGIDCSHKKILELNEHIEKPGHLSGDQRGRKNRHRNSLREEAMSDFLGELLSSPSAALISDAGAPILADPGFRLLEEIRRLNIPITHVAGASSLISGLLLSGFHPDRFYYAGFLPQNHNAREDSLKKLLALKELLVIMETPYRLTGLLTSLIKVFPTPTPIAITFSLSTDEEEVFHGTLKEAQTQFLNTEKNRRPFVLFINNRRK